MIGPWWDRALTPIGPEQWQRLVSEEGYSDVAVTRFPELGIIVKTRWLGHDRDDHVPPRIFVTKAMGDLHMDEITTATEEEALAVHESLCARYREQAQLLADGGAPRLNEGVL